MNDKQDMGEHLAEQQPMCMAKRIEELEAQLEKLTNRLAWRNTGSPNGLRRFMTQKQYKAQTPGIQKWYEPIRREVPEGWQLVPMEPAFAMLAADGCKEHHEGQECTFHKNRRRIWAAMLAAAPKPEGELSDAQVSIADIASLQRYTLGGNCDSFGQDCGVEMEPDDEGEYVLLSEALMLVAAPSPENAK